ncbi:MAG: GntR family transcriptional regulator [Herbaspirillum sp.]|jgi:DNA-binding FadR family transcriptional regulator|nr:GntR family transcriptional regulator [Herbaspirillum sp.]
MSSSNDPAFTLKETLIGNLRNAHWRPGEKLPTERQMSLSHGVGRSTVRRVLQQMKDLGLITQTVGSGTYVAQDIAEKLPQPAAREIGISPAQLMEARLIFEPGLIELVVRNGTASDFDDMEECCRQAEAAETLEQFEHWDGAFHQTIANATHNNFVISVFDLINDVRERGEWGLLKKNSVTPERRDTYQKEHRALLAALRNRDAETAREAVLSHLINVRRNLFNY